MIGACGWKWLVRIRTFRQMSSVKCLFNHEHASMFPQGIRYVCTFKHEHASMYPPIYNVSWFCVLKFLLHEWGHIIYYILSAVFASCFYILFKFRFVREGAQGPPLVIRMYACVYICMYVWYIRMSETLTLLAMDSTLTDTHVQRHRKTRIYTDTDRRARV